MDRPQIVILDGHTLNPGDLTWSVLEAIGECTIYPRTAPELTIERAKSAEIVIVNKHILSADLLTQLPNLRYIGVSATGYNNVDVATANQKGITVSNVAGYSTPAVAQHVFALLLHMTNRVAAYDKSIKDGDWANSPDFSYTLGTLPELTSLTLGIYGLGRIGQAVADIGLAFGMRVLACHKHPVRDAKTGVEFVDLATLFRESNVISLHAPLTPANTQIVNKSLLETMPSLSFLINTGRGALINEGDLVVGLQQGKPSAAALDVLQQEPPLPGHPLSQLDNCYITPHIAWASYSARQRLMAEVAKNIKAFLAGRPQNVLVE